MERRTILTLGFILALIIGAFTLLLTSDAAKKAMKSNLEASVEQATQSK